MLKHVRIKYCQPIENILAVKLTMLKSLKWSFNLKSSCDLNTKCPKLNFLVSSIQMIQSHVGDCQTIQISVQYSGHKTSQKPFIYT